MGFREADAGERLLTKSATGHHTYVHTIPPRHENFIIPVYTRKVVADSRKVDWHHNLVVGYVYIYIYAGNQVVATKLTPLKRRNAHPSVAAQK